jgi:TolB-like protein
MNMFKLHQSLLSLLICLICLSCSVANRAQAKSAINHPNTIAILDLQDLGPSVELEPLRKALPRMLISDLMRYPHVQMVSRERVDQMISEISLGEFGLTSTDSAPKAGYALAADYIIQGTFSGSTDGLTVRLKIFDVLQNHFIDAFEITGKADEIFAVEKQIVEKIAATLALGQPEAPPRLAASGKKPITIALAQLQNLGQETYLDLRQNELTEMLAMQLQNKPNLALVEREKLASVLKELGLQQSALAGNGTTAQVGQLLGTQIIAIGSFVSVKETIRFDVQLVSCETGALVGAISLQGKCGELSSTINMLADRIANALSQQSLSTESVAQAGKASLEAARHYVRGKEFVQQDKFKEAVKELEAAYYLCPDDVVIMTALEECYRHSSSETPDAHIRLKEKMSSSSKAYYRENARCLAYCYAQGNNYEKAITFAEQALAKVRQDQEHTWPDEIALMKALADFNNCIYNVESGPRLTKMRYEAVIIPPSRREVAAYEKAKYWYLQVIALEAAHQKQNVATRVDYRIRLMRLCREQEPALWQQQLEMALAEAQAHKFAERTFSLETLIGQMPSKPGFSQADYAWMKGILGKIIYDHPTAIESAFALEALVKAGDSIGNYREAAEFCKQYIDTWWPKIPTTICKVDYAAKFYTEKLNDPQTANTLRQQVLWHFGCYDPVLYPPGSKLSLPYQPGKPRPILAPGCIIIGGFIAALRAEMNKTGIMVHTNPFSALSEDNRSNPLLLSAYRTIVLVKRETSYDEDFIASLRSHVATGGSLFLFGEHAGLLAAFGMHTQPPVATIDLLKPAPAVLNPKRIVPSRHAPNLRGASPLTIPAEYAVASYQGKPIVAAFRYGLGRVVVCGIDVNYLGQYEGQKWHKATWDFIRDVITWLEKPETGNPEQAAFAAIQQKWLDNDPNGAVTALREFVTTNPGTRAGEEAQLLSAYLSAVNHDDLAASDTYQALANSAKYPQVKLFARLNLLRQMIAGNTVPLLQIIEQGEVIWQENPDNYWAAQALLYVTERAYQMEDFAAAQKAADMVMNSCTSSRPKTVGMYWAALCREKQGDIPGAVRIYRVLATNWEEDLSVNNPAGNGNMPVHSFATQQLEKLAP